MKTLTLYHGTLTGNVDFILDTVSSHGAPTAGCTASSGRLTTPANAHIHDYLTRSVDEDPSLNKLGQFLSDFFPSKNLIAVQATRVPTIPRKPISW